MGERERVQHLDRGRDADGHRIVGVAPGTDVGPMEERRTQPFAAAEHELLEGVERFVEHRVDRGPAFALTADDLTEASIDGRRDGGDRVGR